MISLNEAFVQLFREHSGVYRPNWNEFFLTIASIVASRSTCNVIASGAVIVKDKQIISMGYCGAPVGFEHCCQRGDCWKDHSDVAQCLGVHAPINAIIYANGRDLKGSTIYIAGYDLKKECMIDAQPCGQCMGAIKNAGIEKIVTASEAKATQLI